ncbi:MAG: ATP synthase F0 subunit B [Bacilli bacterium]
MEIDKEFWTTLFFTVLNILILYFILKKILFKPVTKYMETRSNKIKEALDMAEEAKAKVEAMEEEHQARLKEAKEEGIALINSYEQKAKNEYDNIIANAKKDFKC